MANKELTAPKKRTAPWLTQYHFKPGESGNPAGREKGHKYSLRAVLRGALNSKGYKFAIKRMKDLGIDMTDGTHGDLIAAILLHKAEGGDMEAIREIIKLVERPFSPAIPGMGEEGEELPDNSINVTVKIVKTTNIQNNFKGLEE